MGRSEARLHVSIWRNDDFLRLRGDEQLAYFVLLSQSTVSMCGVLPVQTRAWARMRGDGTVASLEEALQGLERERYIIVDEETGELWVRTFVRYDGVLRSPNLIVSMTRDFDSIRSKRIRTAFLEELGDTFLKSLPQELRERLPLPFLEEYREHFPGTLPPKDSGTVPETLPPVAGTLPPKDSGTVPETLRGTASHACASGAHHAEPPPPPPPPSPSPSPPPRLETRGAVAVEAGPEPRDRSTTNGKDENRPGPRHRRTPAEQGDQPPATARRADPLVARLSAIRGIKPATAAAAVARMRRAGLADQVIDEAIGKAIEAGAHSARYVEQVAHDWMTQRDPAWAAPADDRDPKSLAEGLARIQHARNGTGQ